MNSFITNVNVNSQDVEEGQLPDDDCQIPVGLNQNTTSRVFEAPQQDSHSEEIIFETVKDQDYSKDFEYSPEKKKKKIHKNNDHRSNKSAQTGRDKEKYANQKQKRNDKKASNSNNYGPQKQDTITQSNMLNGMYPPPHFYPPYMYPHPIGMPMPMAPHPMYGGYPPIPYMHPGQPNHYMYKNSMPIVNQIPPHLHPNQMHALHQHQMSQINQANQYKNIPPPPTKDIIRQQRQNPNYESNYKISGPQISNLGQFIPPPPPPPPTSLSSQSAMTYQHQNNYNSQLKKRQNYVSNSGNGYSQISQNEYQQLNQNNYPQQHYNNSQANYSNQQNSYNHQQNNLSYLNQSAQHQDIAKQDKRKQGLQQIKKQTKKILKIFQSQEQEQILDCLRNIARFIQKNSSISTPNLLAVSSVDNQLNSMLMENHDRSLAKLEKMFDAYQSEGNIDLPKKEAIVKLFIAFQMKDTLSKIKERKLKKKLIGEKQQSQMKKLLDLLVRDPRKIIR